MKAGWLMAALLLAGSETAHAAYDSGNELKTWSDASARISAGRIREGDEMDSGLLSGYITGVVDSIDGIMACVPQAVTIGQLKAVTAQYIEQHPAEWARPAFDIVGAAISAAFPCA